MPLIHTIVSGTWRENCYILQAGPDAVVIDPGEDAHAIMSFLDTQSLHVRSIVCTHAHYDHVGSVSELKARDGAPFYLHAADHRLLRQANFYRKLFGGERAIAIPDVDVDLAACATLHLAGIQLEVIHTPGHTPGSVSFLMGESLFGGDTIFGKRIGRTDLPGGDKAAITASVRRLVGLAPSITLYPGHGTPVTLAELFATNRELAEMP